MLPPVQKRSCFIWCKLQLGQPWPGAAWRRTTPQAARTDKHIPLLCQASEDAGDRKQFRGSGQVRTQVYAYQRLLLAGWSHCPWFAWPSPDPTVFISANSTPWPVIAEAQFHAKHFWTHCSPCSSWPSVPHEHISNTTASVICPAAS